MAAAWLGNTEMLKPLFISQQALSAMVFLLIPGVSAMASGDILKTWFKACSWFFPGTYSGSKNFGAKEMSTKSLWNEKEISITAFDGVKLSGTLSGPPNPKALIIPVHGSFLQDRDGALDGKQKWMFPEGVPTRRLFAEISHILRAREIGTFRYDKRASGKSGGIYEETDLVILAKDVTTVLAEMRKEYPLIPIGLLGQSEGGLTVLKAWADGARPDFLILQAPALEPFDVAFQFQKDRGAKPFLNDPTGEMARKYPYVTAFYQAWESGEMQRKILHSDEDQITLRLGEWSHTTSLRKYRQYLWNGLDLLRKVTVPTGIFWGTKDGNVSGTPFETIIREKVSSKFPNVDVFILEGLEHSFRDYDPTDTVLTAMAKPTSAKYVSALIHFVDSLVLPSPESPLQKQRSFGSSLGFPG